MKGIVVTTDLEIRIEEFSDPLYKTVGSAVGGYIEHVKPARLRHPYCMIVNEEGRLLDLPLNYVGSYFYGTDQHGEPIVGNIVIMKDGYRGGEPDIVGLNDVEAEQIKDVIIDLIEPLHQQPKGEST
ncbi:MAG: protein of unknown function DUF3846 [Bacteriophage sp.]|jgi:hypothetical protein|nr:DUF3846 domain-containing protein [Clostridiales bacterium]MCI6936917.1 DUF3846 domain-containing protein [Clostridiales bacterium]UWH94183.1 MAG: protein of unknown function DUF3846 [Bacteriophage sp.]